MGSSERVRTRSCLLGSTTSIFSAGSLVCRFFITLYTSFPHLDGDRHLRFRRDVTITFLH